MNAPSARAPLVGRAAETAAIAALLDGLEAAGPAVALVSGEPGIGKTRLITAATDLAREAGAQVLEGYALDATGLPPFYALRRALSRLSPQRLAEVQAPATELAALAGAGMLPRLTQPLPELASLEPEAERIRLFEAVAGLLLRLSSQAALVVALDDLQWADRGTWDALVYVTRFIAPAPVMFVLGVRDEALGDPASPAAIATAGLSRLHLLTRLHLRSLDAAELAALAGQLLGGPAGDDLVEHLAGRSDGNPFLAEELLRDLQERNALVERAGAWLLAEQAVAGSAQAPLSVQTSVAQRLQVLPAPAVRALEAAAVLGRVFSAQDVAAMLGQGPADTWEALRTAELAGVIRADAGQWRFVHDTVREAIYELTGASRPALHAAAADTLARGGGGAAGLDRLVAVAYHRRESGDAAQGASAAMAAANAAAAAYAGSEALEFARSAHDQALAAEAAGALPSGASEFAGLHAEAAVRVGEFAEAQAALRELIGRAEQDDDAESQGRLWARTGVIARRQERPEEAAAALNRAISLLEAAPGAEDALVEALTELASLEGLTRARYVEAEELGARALELARRGGDSLAGARAALAMAHVRSRAVGPTAGREFLEQALTSAEAGGDRLLAAEACAALSNSYYWTGEMRRSRSYAERRLALAEAAGDVFGLRHAHSWLALVSVACGDWDRARSLLDTSEPMLERLDSPEPISFLRLVRAQLEYQCGDLELAYDLASRAVAEFSKVDPATVLWYGGVLALVCMDSGRTDEARAEVAVLEQQLAGLEAGALPARSARTVLGLLYARLGHTESALGCEEALRPYGADYHWTPARRTLAVLAHLRGDTAVALADLDAAEALARAEGLRPDVALCLLERARVLGNTAAGAAALQEAQTLLTSLGMTRYVEASTGAQGTQRPPVQPGGLTQREVEVIRLVAEGRTNREIAAALVITERTVINHLSHIFAKIGADNRAGATAFALRNNLV